MMQNSYNKDNKKQETRNTTDKGSLILAEEPQTKKEYHSYLENTGG